MKQPQSEHIIDLINNEHVAVWRNGKGDTNFECLLDAQRLITYVPLLTRLRS
jgi:hypothetical protein